MNTGKALEGLRVEVVEDEALIAEELRDRLSNLGALGIDVVDSAEQAIACAKQFRPDLILMDIRLHGPMDGVQAMAVIRQSVSAPVVFLTAHSDAETLRRFRGLDPFAYVRKPFQERELLVAVETALRAR